VVRTREFTQLNKEANENVKNSDILAFPEISDPELHLSHCIEPIWLQNSASPITCWSKTGDAPSLGFMRITWIFDNAFKLRTTFPAFFFIWRYKQAVQVKITQSVNCKEHCKIILIKESTAKATFINPWTSPIHRDLHRVSRHGKHSLIFLLNLLTAQITRNWRLNSYV